MRKCHYGTCLLLALLLLVTNRVKHEIKLILCLGRLLCKLWHTISRVNIYCFRQLYLPAWFFSVWERTMHPASLGLWRLQALPGRRRWAALQWVILIAPLRRLHFLLNTVLKIVTSKLHIYVFACLASFALITNLKCVSCIKSHTYLKLNYYCFWEL